MGRAPIIPLAPGVYRIPTLGDFINSFAFVDDDESVTLVDCGVKRAPAKIVSALEAIGKTPADVTRIVLTHAHNDHAGGAAQMVQRSSVDGVMVHADDAEFISSGIGAPRDESVRFGAMFSRMPGGGFAPVDVNEHLHDGFIIDVAGGIRVVHTPGHTPGHISLLHEPTSVLITGDAIWNMRSRMSWPIAAFCTSAALNQKTAYVLGELDYSVAAFTHGPQISIDAREAVRGFLNGSSRN